MPQKKTFLELHGFHNWSCECLFSPIYCDAAPQGLGNDFILIDNRSAAEPILSPAASSKICDRNFGIGTLPPDLPPAPPPASRPRPPRPAGADGVIFALPPDAPGQDFRMRIYNSDGSEPEMCGNGIRCLARFVAQRDAAPPRSYKVGTLGGLMVPDVRADGQVAVDMGEPILEPSRVPTSLPASHARGAAVAVPMRVGDRDWKVTAVSMGNPHCIVFSNPDGTPLEVRPSPVRRLSACPLARLPALQRTLPAPPPPRQLGSLDLAAIGPVFEHNPAFPKRTNTGAPPGLWAPPPRAAGPRCRRRHG